MITVMMMITIAVMTMIMITAMIMTLIMIIMMTMEIRMVMIMVDTSGSHKGKKKNDKMKTSNSNCGDNMAPSPL